MEPTSCSSVILCVLVAMVTKSSGDVDPEVCIPQVPLVPLPVPSAALGDVWEAEIEWKDETRNRTYFVTDSTDMPNKKEKLVISIPFQDDVTLLYNWNSQNVIVEETVRSQQDSTHQTRCRVQEHSYSEVSYAYDGLFWLTSLQVLLEQFIDAKDALLVRPTQVRGINANNWTACLYDFVTNMTVRTNLYFTDPKWWSTHQPPSSEAPLRLEYVGRIHNGSKVTEVNLIGDIVSFKKKDSTDTFPPGFFTTQTGVTCPNRTEFMRFPGFPSQLSVTLETLDMNYKHISYEEFYYDSELKMVRDDYKSAKGSDPDVTSYIFDFQVGVKYIIDRRMMSCQPPSPLSVGDDFVVQQPNGTLNMKSMAEYFHYDNADIEYVGQATVRNVECNTWIGRYFDQDANRNNVVQWYFTTKNWLEATGTVQGGQVFFMMKVWERDSINPTIYNIMKYESAAPAFDVFDFSACFSSNAKKHFTIEFQVSGMEYRSQLSTSYLTRSLTQDLANRLEIQINRFTDITFDWDDMTSSVFMSATMLDRTILTEGNSKEIALDGAFAFLKGSIDASHISCTLKLSDSNITFTGISLVEHNFRLEFATTTSTTPPSTKIVAPTIVPPKRRTATTEVLPTIPPTTTTVTCPPAPVCSCPSTVPQTVLTRLTSCPPPLACPTKTVTCPISKPCSTLTTGAVTRRTPPTQCPVQKPCPAVPTCPPVRSCPTPKPCPSLSTPLALSDTQCPTPQPCPSQTPCSVTSTECPPQKPCSSSPSSTCSCPQSTAAPCLAALIPAHSDTGISAGVLAGAVIVSILFALAVGIVASRFYHIKKISGNQLTINILDDNM